MTTKTKAALFGAVILLGTWITVNSWPTGPEDPAFATAGGATLEGEANIAESTTPARKTLGADETTLAFGHGTRVAGQLVDEDGHAAPRMLLVFAPAGSDEETDWVYAPTDHRGEFVAEHGLAAGRYTVRIRVGRPLVEARTITIDDNPRVPLVLRVRRPGPRDSISGIVVRDDGSPAARVGISAERSFTQTNSRGVFVLKRSVDDRDARTTLTISDPRGSRAVYEWGSTGVRLQLHRDTPFRLRALRADTRAPVMEFECHTNILKFESRGPGTSGVSTEDGIARMKTGSLLPGRKWRISILPRARDLFPRTIVLGWRDVQSKEPIEVLVPAARRTRFRCLDRAGQPVANALIEMVRSHIENVQPSFDGFPNNIHRDGSWNSMLNLIAWGHTDAEGIVELSGEAWQKGGPTLLVSGSNIAPAILDPADTVLRDGIHEVTIQRGAHIRGRISNVGALEDTITDKPRLLLETTKGRVARMPPRRFADGYPVDAEGRFEMQNVPAGAWALKLANGPTLARITLSDGEDRVIDFDAKTLVPGKGELRGTVRIIGQSEQILIESPAALTDDYGDFGPKEMTAGKHSLNLWVRLEGQQRYLREVAEYEVAPNKTTRINIDLRVVKVAVRLVTIDGQPVPFEHVYLLRGDDPRYNAAADAKGHVEFFLLKGRKYDVALRPIDYRVAERTRRFGGKPRWIRLGSFVPGETGKGAAFVVR